MTMTKGTFDRIVKGALCHLEPALSSIVILVKIKLCPVVKIREEKNY